MDGLRTLVLCTRDLTEQEFNAWKAAHHNAAIAIGKCNFQFHEKIKNGIPAKKIYKKITILLALKNITSS